MSNRPARSPSIPIPGNPRIARIEDVLVLPPILAHSPNPRSRTIGFPRSHINNSPERAFPSSSPRTISTAPPRAISGSYSLVASRPSPGLPTNQSQPVFEPRIIRATPSPSRASDPACFPASTSPSASRTRRPSATRHASGANSAVVATGVRPSALSAQLQSSALPPPQTFPRPAYLDQSALRDLLVTEPSVPSTVTRHSEQPSRISITSPPHPAPHVLSGFLTSHSHSYIRQSSPSVDDYSDREGTTSPPPASIVAQPIAPMTAFMSQPVFRLPTRWSEMDRHPSLQVSPDGRDLTFCGPACAGDKDAAAARANYPVPPCCGIYYYEVEILQKGNKGHISIGYSAGDVRISRLPGWERHSWGYHADDGWSFPGHKDGNPYGPTYDTGDIIGCGVDFSQHRAFYTKNGNFLGMVFDNVGKGHEIYPAIGLRHTNEAIRVNFGHAPFKFAIEDHVLSQRNSVWGKIQATKIDWDLLRGGSSRSSEVEENTGSTGATAGTSSVVEESENNAEDKSPMRELVLSYLAHHGYVKTVKAFQAQCEGRATSREDGMETDEAPFASSSSTMYASAQSSQTGRGFEEMNQDLDLIRRVEIVNAVSEGDIDTAITQTQVYFPDVFKHEEGLVLFKLKCRKFVELILEASEALKRVKAEEKQKENNQGQAQSQRGRRDTGKERYVATEVPGDALDGSGAMDVDDPSPEARTPVSEPTTLSSSSSSTTPPDAVADPNSSIPSNTIPITRTSSSSSSSSSTNTATVPASAIAKNALQSALTYGQTLEADYKSDVRPEVKSHLKRTFGVVAFTDPLAAGGEVAEMAGQEARMRLATELNQAILESLGKPRYPALEMAYRQASACIVQLGLLSYGPAAFADMSKEFLDG